MPAKREATGGLTHFDERGAARMVDVGAKPVTRREAVARGAVRMSGETLRRVADRAVEKGDVLGVARVAGILAAKRTGDLIPMCHPLGLSAITIEFRLVGPETGVREHEAQPRERGDEQVGEAPGQAAPPRGAAAHASLVPGSAPPVGDDRGVGYRVEIEAVARVEARTGVEMEALTAVSVAALTIYDMCKSVDRGMTVEAIRLVRKSGGRSGRWVRPGERDLPPEG